MRYIKTIVLLAILMFPSLYGSTFGCNISKTHSVITIKEKTVQGTLSGTCLSENLNDSIIQPGQVIGRHLDAAGNIDNELTSQFSYHENGKVKKFDFPDYVLSTSFHYDGDFMKKEFTYHRAGYPEVEECLDYDYDEKGLLVSMSHTWSLMESNQYWSYQYNGEGRLVRKELGDGHDTWEFWLYDYEEDGHKRTDVKVSAGVDNAVVRFYDLQGRLRDARPFDFSTTINAGGWPSGVYLWEIWRDDQKLGSGKWVKN